MTNVNINPNFTKEEVDSLQKKIEKNSATIEDYKVLDYFMSLNGTGKEFFLRSLKEKDIDSYDEFIKDRNNFQNIGEKQRGNINIIVNGTIISIFSFLNNCLKK
jgi:hypothetical protein